MSKAVSTLLERRVFEFLSMDELSTRTGVSVRKIRYYMRLGLVSRPEGGRSKARYDSQHIMQINRVLRLIENGWSPVQQAELLTLPAHWSRFSKKQAGEQQRSPQEGYVAITTCIRVAWDDRRSPLEVKLIKAMAEAGRQELQRQQKTAKSLGQRQRTRRKETKTSN